MSKLATRVPWIGTAYCRRRTDSVRLSAYESGARHDLFQSILYAANDELDSPRFENGVEPFQNSHRRAPHRPQRLCVE